MANTYAQKTITWGHGQNAMYAGTPLDTNGKPVNDSSAVGILAEDIRMPDRTAKMLTAGTWDEENHRGSGIIISDAVKLKLSDITFTHPPVQMVDAATLAETLSTYVQSTDLATTEAAGIVKQSAAVADAADAPTQAEFNGLLEALRSAGIIEQTTPDPDPDDPEGT